MDEPKPIPLVGQGIDTVLLGDLQRWMNERYAAEINSLVRPLLGRRIRLDRKASGRLATFAGKTAKLTDAVMHLDDNRLFRWKARLDATGEEVADLVNDNFSWSLLTDRQVEAELATEAAEKTKQAKLKKELQAKHGPRVKITNSNTGKVVLDAPVMSWEVKPSGKPEPLFRVKIGERPVGPDEDAVGRLVRVIDANRHPGTYLSDGFVNQVYVGGSSREYRVRLKDGKDYVFKDKELRFL